VRRREPLASHERVAPLVPTDIFRETGQRCCPVTAIVGTMAVGEELAEWINEE
jgi:hypothetical protein